MSGGSGLTRCRALEGIPPLTLLPVPPPRWRWCWCCRGMSAAVSASADAMDMGLSSSRGETSGGRRYADCWSGGSGRDEGRLLLLPPPPRLPVLLKLLLPWLAGEK